MELLFLNDYSLVYLDFFFALASLIMLLNLNDIFICYYNMKL